MAVMCKQFSSIVAVHYFVEGVRVVRQLVLLYFLADSELATHSFVTAAITDDWSGFSWLTRVCLWYCSNSLVASFPSDC